ncbi:MAG: hypothetical protein P8L37_01795 [Phycisphaerales bacterium]|nr:hypothetical protein [Phycisphaerales bacterium]
MPVNDKFALSALPLVSSTVGSCVRLGCRVQDVIVDHVDEGAIGNEDLKVPGWVLVQYWFSL